MYLGIDVGTQSVKALLYDAAAKTVRAVESAELQLISDADGTREQLAQWWLEAIADCLSRIPAALLLQVQAMAVSGQQHGFVALDGAGKVLAPVKLWCDTATAAQCVQITDAMGGEAQCIERAGNAILPGYTAPKILWLKQHRPQDYAALTTILLPHDYVNFYLTGERVMEYGDASGTGLLDIANRTWHTAMLAAVDADRDLAGVLPPLVDPHTPIGQLLPAVADALGLPAGIPVAPGGGDNMMAAIGTANVSAGRMTVSLGTSGTLFASSDTPVIDAQGAIAGFCSSTGGWLPLLCTMNCTVATELTRKVFDVSLAELEAAVDASEPGAQGVVTLPFFNGERSPNLPNGKGCVLGLDAHNYFRSNLLRSAMESAVYAMQHGLQRFSELGCSIDSLRLTGGGAASPAWRQMVADIFDLPVSVQACDEGAALGAALQACWVHGGGKGSDELQRLLDAHLVLDETRCCEPDASRASTYRELYERYSRHVEIVAALYR